MLNLRYITTKLSLRMPGPPDTGINPSQSTQFFSTDLPSDSDHYSEDDPSFTTQRKRPPKSQLTNALKKYQCIIPTKNRYELLQNEEENTNEVTNKPIRIPPIYLQEVNDYKAIIDDLTKLLKSGYTTKQLGNKSIKINVSTITDYRQLAAYYDAQKIQFYTFSLPDQNKISVIVRSVPPSLSEEEIYTELSKDYPVTKVVRLLNKRKEPMPICAVDLKKNESAATIFNLRHIMNAIVTVEPRRKSNDIPQCTRCQSFGHTKNFCRLEAKCHKCAGVHHYTECKKKKEETPKCINCNGEHPANYRGCQHYQNLKLRISKSNQPNFRPQNFNDNTNSNTQNNPDQRKFSKASSSRSYASVIQNDKHTTSFPHTTSAPENHPQPTESNKSSSLLSQIIDIIKPYMEQIKTFITTLISSLF